MAKVLEIDQWEEQGNKHVDVTLKRPLPYHKVLADLVSKYTPDAGSLLDIGCGMGAIDSIVSENRQDIGIWIADAYKVCLETTAARANIQGTFLLDEKSFDIDQTIDRQFDTIVMSHVLEHIHNPSDAVRTILTKVKPGGHLILAVPNPVRPGVFIQAAMRRHYANRGHIQAWDFSHWRLFLEEALELDVVEYAHDAVLLPLISRLDKNSVIGEFFAKVFPWWSVSNIAVIRCAETQPESLAAE